MIESYFQNRVVIESEWHYNSGAYLQEFQQKPQKRCWATNEVIEDVEERVENKSINLLRHLSQEVGFSPGTCHKIVKKRSIFARTYKLHPYHDLWPYDFNKRLSYCR